MIFKIDGSSEVPIYLQIRNMFVNLIAIGELQKGDDIPSVRSLARDLNLNMMTVQKAYTLLKDEGFIEVDRRSGSRIYSGRSLKDEVFEEKFKDIVREALARGYEKSEIERMISDV